MTGISITALILGSASSFVACIVAMRSLLDSNRKRAIASAENARITEDNRKRIEALEKIVNQHIEWHRQQRDYGTRW